MRRIYLYVSMFRLLNNSNVCRSGIYLSVIEIIVIYIHQWSKINLSQFHQVY